MRRVIIGDKNEIGDWARKEKCFMMVRTVITRDGCDII